MRNLVNRRRAIVVAALAIVLLIIPTMLFVQGDKSRGYKKNAGFILPKTTTYPEAVALLGEPGMYTEKGYTLPRGLANQRANSKSMASWKEWADDECAIFVYVDKNQTIIDMWVLEPDEHQLPWYRKLF